MKPQLTIEAFADWCEKQPAKKTYPYNNCCGQCAYGQYLTWLGLPVEYVGIDVWKNRETGRFDAIPEWVDPLVIAHPWTFGALALRLRATVQP